MAARVAWSCVAACYEEGVVDGPTAELLWIGPRRSVVELDWAMSAAMWVGEALYIAEQTWEAPG